MEVVSVYERKYYQLYAQEIRLNGIGELYVAYEMLKQKLYEEGLFDHEIKKPIPKNPKKIEEGKRQEQEQQFMISLVQQSVGIRMYS